MLTSYRAIFRYPGTRAFAAAGFVMRIPIAVYPLALILMFSVGGDFGRAGLFTAAYVAGGAIGLPLLSRLVDQRGQRVVMIPATVVHVAAVAVVVALAQAGAPDPVTALAVLVVGLSYIAIGSLVRARWSYVLPAGPELSSAYSLESVLDELIFVIGPIVASVVCVAIAPSAGVVAGAILVTVGLLWFAPQHATEPPPAPAGGATGFALRHRGMINLTLAMACLGATFAGVEVSIAAFASQHGHRSITGLLLAGFALGSGTAGFLYGARHWTADFSIRFVIQAAVFAALTPLFLLVGNVVALGLVAIVVGLGIAPTLILCFGMVDRLVPPHRLTEGLSWVVTGLNVGYGISAALAGLVADAHGAHLAFVLPVITAASLVVVTLVLRRRLHGYEPDHLAIGGTAG